MVAAAKKLNLSGGFAFRSSGLLIALVLILLMEITAYRSGVNAFSVLISGLALGSLYALVALGYTMVYGIIELINFAHGDVFAVGGFVSLTLLEHFDNAMVSSQQFTGGQNTVHLLGTTFRIDVVWLAIGTIVVSILFAALICGILGVLIERIAYRRLRNAPRLAPLITAIGISFIIENLLFQWRGGTILQYPSILPLRQFVWVGAQFSNIDLLVIASSILLMILLDRFVNQTKVGKAMRAVAQDPEAALMMGINVDRIIATTFFVGSALAGAGCVIYGMQQGGIGSSMGFSLGLFAFTAAVLGGIGNIRGAMLGGILIGVIQRFVDALGSGSGTQWADVVVFLILIAVLVFRPSGLLGAQVPEKV